MHPRKNVHFYSSRKMWGALAVAVLILGYLVYMQYWLPKQASSNIFNLLQENGYTPNPGFSGLFRPGNIIQVTEPEANGKEHALPTPVLFAWADECFPGQGPRTQEFTVPHRTGKLAASLTVSGEDVTRLIPSLSLSSEAIADYSIQLENTRVQAFAKGDLSGGFSQPCVEKLKRAMRVGDKIEWFRLVLASVVADAVTLLVQWKSDSTADARSQVIETVQNALARGQATAGGTAKDPGLNLAITNSTQKETAISARGFVIIGYQARPIQPENGQ